MYLFLERLLDPKRLPGIISLDLPHPAGPFVSLPGGRGSRPGIRGGGDGLLAGRRSAQDSHSGFFPPKSLPSSLSSPVSQATVLFGGSRLHLLR